ncbi:hypothetical protein KDW_38430 [Dictyobacter vulcani]|uniref:Uncharacterized protein n=1 Tax=Dictyobacter vulcani TaxID=2607529 RepID=A0A5J4KT98_9CHLR|nr:hypothetical protein [Dictyobacter vulcani]GER89681.1 hypothetical protein KDW_38430 [Dictyobacter vulcani]
MSEVALLRKKIEDECRVLNLYMNEFRATASHDVINHQFEAISPLQQELTEIVGEKEAARITVEAYIGIVG